MLELLVCSLLTILPDYLFRRYVQGKRLGKEITFYSVWFELRWGIILCLLLTVGLITVIFYYHPSTTNVVSYFRTIPIVPEINGRVAEIYIGMNDRVAKGAPIFRLDSRSKKQPLRPPVARLPRSTPRWWSRARTSWRRKARSRRPRGPTSRPLMNWRPNRSCSGATRALWRAGISRSLRSPSRAAKARLRRPRPLNRVPRRRSPPSFQPKRRAPKPRWPRPKQIRRRPSSGLASAGRWSSSPCAWATSSIRSCARPGS